MGDVRVCWVIGDPIEHSLSPLMHEAGYQALGLIDEFTFIRKRIPPQDLGDAIAEARLTGVRGISVTMPHKQAVCSFVDRIDDEAKRVGAVNTVVNTDGELVGYNTDVLGIQLPLLLRIGQRRPLHGIVLGAGGAARSAIVALQNLQIHVTVLNRTLENARQLSEEYQCDYGELGDYALIHSADVIVNTTPSGMDGRAGLSLGVECFRSEQVIFDIVYTPYWTPLLRLAEKAGATCIHGIEMFVQQGGKQFQLYTGVSAPLEALKQAVEGALQSVRS